MDAEGTSTTGKKKGAIQEELDGLSEKLSELQTRMETISLNQQFIPNTEKHIRVWASHYKLDRMDIPFTSHVPESIVMRLMALTTVPEEHKLLLLMGIGLFSESNDTEYMNLMRALADEQQLYLILATEAFIYGTNYQFFHAYIGKQLTLTQEQVIQTIGRVGRRNATPNYTVRLRDNQVLLTLFDVPKEGEDANTRHPEIVNLQRLFCHDEVVPRTL